jgi:hypothetical protein
MWKIEFKMVLQNPLFKSGSIYTTWGSYPRDRNLCKLKLLPRFTRWSVADAGRFEYRIIKEDL